MPDFASEAVIFSGKSAILMLFSLSPSYQGQFAGRRAYDPGSVDNT